MFLAVVSIFFLHHLNTKNLPVSWPVVGMLPSLLLNLHRVLDWCTYYLSKNQSTFVFKGPWFTNMANIVVTSDPANMRHIFNTNFANYPKGPEFKEFFDVLGDGIFNADSDSWKSQRRTAHQLINHEKFRSFLEQTSCNKVQSGLIPVLENVVEKNMVVDLQELFRRFSFDNTVNMITGIDPGSLSTKFSKFPCVDAFDDIEEAIFYRHALPEKWWKLQRWLAIGKEKKLSDAREVLDNFLVRCISEKRETYKGMVDKKENEEMCVDLLTSYMEEEEILGSKLDVSLRDTLLNLMFAGRSTVSVALTWFFFLVLQNPIVETKIIKEIKSKGNAQEKDGGKIRIFDMEGLKGCVYLHGAICEALRLFPSVPFEHKRPVKPDILPSGHRVDSKTKILPLLYAMGRMEDIWGDKCLEFKPERWISDTGGIKFVPTYKFMAFNSGPRTCVGKGIALTQMKMVAATMLYNYHFEAVELHSVSPKNSIILSMSSGMKSRIRRRA